MGKLKLIKKSKKRVTIEDLQTIQTAYFTPLSYRDYFKTIITPAVLFAFFTQILFYYWQLTFFALVFGAIVGAVNVLPNSVRTNYNKRSYIERNRFLNSTTQLLINPDYTVLHVLKKVTPRIEGELNADLLKLMASLSVGSNMEIRTAFSKIINKYPSDIIFSQFMEQLETSHFEGNNDVEVLKDIKTHHNELLEKQSEFFNKKKNFIDEFKGLIIIMLVLIGMISIIFSLDKYINQFAHHITGWIAISAFLACCLYAYFKIMKVYFNDSVTEVK